MAFVVNIVSEVSNVGKTTVIEGIIKELKNRGYSVGTIKHDAHEFDIDKKGKDTYRHREAGSETVIISSKNRMAMIKEVENEMPLEELLDMVSDKDFIIVEGYKKSPLRKIEVFRSGVSKNIITPKDKLICLATDTKLDIEGIEQVSINDYRKLTDCLEKLKYNDERRC
ncbi:molybdopterin-guanine dinucleotide biosynthesis protein B [Clostridium sp.]|uniref:molybdopterin-guanine dinucleotide biosynthesis protein B n=1 Tax=Clostridium sp. TaxID=1506 RepID=UPI002A91572F|nr:molybdopterin-guanine dinucleotide biosynthesis protein B [Clostridium sp.]MDY6012627.1 molybdopterin-guanine dinucleotide biosynthesis protein B [Clostridium sp.]